MKRDNPFLTAGYAVPETFCDREKETADMVSALRNGRNVTLIAPRRYGKTWLIRNMMESLPSRYDKVYIDIYATECLSDFVKAFAQGVVSSLETKSEKVVSAIGRFFGALRPSVAPQPDGSVKWSFDLAQAADKSSIEGVFAFLRSRKKPVVIAIDEFQQVMKYPEKGTEALLRSYIQFAPNVHFVFAGSQQHLMSGMFVSPRGAFYNSTDIMSLDVIDIRKYRTFARKFFANEGLPFSKTAFDDLYGRFDGITWYVQSVLNRVWEKGRGFKSRKDTDSALASLVDNRNLVYFDLFRSQSEASRRLLRAVAADGVVSEPTGKAFLGKHSLGAASTVSSVLANLVDRELLYASARGYVVYDRLFSLWLNQIGR
jgi:hypothetical protein